MYELKQLYVCIYLSGPAEDERLEVERDTHAQVDRPRRHDDGDNDDDNGEVIGNIFTVLILHHYQLKCSYLYLSSLHVCLSSLT